MVTLAMTILVHLCWYQWGYWAIYTRVTRLYLRLCLMYTAGSQPIYLVHASSLDRAAFFTKPCSMGGGGVGDLSKLIQMQNGHISKPKP